MFNSYESEKMWDRFKQIIEWSERKMEKEEEIRNEAHSILELCFENTNFSIGYDSNESLTNSIHLNGYKVKSLPSEFIVSFRNTFGIEKLKEFLTLEINEEKIVAERL